MGRLWCWVGKGKGAFQVSVCSLCVLRYRAERIFTLLSLHCLRPSTLDSDDDTGVLPKPLMLLVSNFLTACIQVYDAPVNRSPFPVGTGRGPNANGCENIDCGVANFGMVRM